MVSSSSGTSSCTLSLLPSAIDGFERHGNMSVHHDAIKFRVKTLFSVLFLRFRWDGIQTTHLLELISEQGLTYCTWPYIS